MPKKLDQKDYAILRELDIDYRASFSEIAKRVKLTKNSVALRYERLKPYISHGLTVYNYDILGYTQIRVFYTFDFYNQDLESEIVEEFKKHRSLMWAARLYGQYDLCICFFVSNFTDFISQILKFNKRFKNHISRRTMLIYYEQVQLRHNFIHKEPIFYMNRQGTTDRKVSISPSERKILLTIQHRPRMSMIDIAKDTGLSAKTVSAKLKELRKKGILQGYFMSLDPVKFGFATFKLLMQVKSDRETVGLFEFLPTVSNIRFIGRIVGQWDYEIDCIYPNITVLQEELERIKEKFPAAIKRVEILSLGKRIVTSRSSYLES